MPSRPSPAPFAAPGLAVPLLLCLAPAAGPPAEELRIELAPDAELTTTLELTQRRELLDGAMSLDGRRREMPEGFTLEVVERFAVAVTDRYPSGARDREAELERSYDSVERAVSFDVAEGERAARGRLEYESPLDGARVGFSMVDGERVRRALDEDERARPLDPRLLAPLRADLGAWAALPAGPVAIGARWTLTGEGLADLLLPGGDVAPGLFDQTLAEGDGAERLDELGLFLFGGLEHGLEELDGELGLSLEGVEEGLARIALRGTLEGAGAPLAAAEEHFAGLVDEGEPLAVERFELTVELELEGLLLWDLAAGRAASLEWTAETSSTIEMELFEPERELELEVEFTLGGETRLALRIE